jgi:hypothetical protein
MPSHAELDVVCLEVLKGGEFTLDQSLDALSALSWSDLEAVQVLAEDCGLGRAETVVLGELKATNSGEVVAVKTSLHQHREWLSVGLSVGAPVIREAYLDFFQQRRLLELEQDPILISQSSLETSDHQAILVRSLVARPINLAVCGGNVTTSVVISENELLVGQLAEDQLWRLIKRRLLFLLLAAPWSWLAFVCLCLAHCLCVGEQVVIVLLAVEYPVDIGST